MIKVTPKILFDDETLELIVLGKNQYLSDELSPRAVLALIKALAPAAARVAENEAKYGSGDVSGSEESEQTRLLRIAFKLQRIAQIASEPEER